MTLNLRSKTKYSGGGEIQLPPMNNKRYDEFKKMLLIDRDSLDEAVMQHAHILMEISEEAANMGSIRDRKKEQVELLFSSLTLDERARASKDGARVTVDQVNAMVAMSPKYQKAIEEYQDINLVLSKWEALKSSYISRGYMLRELCGLHATGYFTSNSVKGGASGDHAVDFMRRNAGNKK